MALLGALAALMAMVREQDAFFVVGPAIDFLVDAAAPATRLRAARRSAAAVAGAAASPVIVTCRRPARTSC